MTRHEVQVWTHTHSAERRLIKTDKIERSTKQSIEAGKITGLQAIALKIGPYGYRQTLNTVVAST